MSVHSSFGNGYVLKAFDLQDVVIPASGLLTTEFVNVSEFNCFNLSVHNDSGQISITYFYSIDGTINVDKSYNYDTFLMLASPNMQVFGPNKIQAKYLSIQIAGAPLLNLNVQALFRKGLNAGSGTVDNVGAFTQIYVSGTDSPAELRTIQCSNASLSITQNPTNIDLQVIGGASSPYQITADDITPVSLSCNSVVSGTGNVVGALSLNNVIGGSNTCTLGNSSTVQECGIIASDTCSIIRGTNSGISCSLSSNIDNTYSSSDKNRSSITACDTCVIGGPSNNRVIVASDNCTMNYGESDAIIASSSCHLDAGVSSTLHPNGFMMGCVNVTHDHSGGGDTGSQYGFIASSDITHTGDSGIGGTVISCVNNCKAGGSNGAYYNSVIASDTSTIGKGINNVILSSDTSSISNAFAAHPSNNAIVGGTGHALTGNGNTAAPDRCVIIGGSNATVLGNLDDVVMMVDGTAISATVSSQLTVKKAGGTRIYSNDLATTGVTLAAGSSSWAVVSDVNQKENLIPVVCHDIMEKVDQLPMFDYNYIGNDPRIKSKFCTAQDFYNCFPVEQIEDRDDLGAIIYEEDGVTPKTHPAKDMTKIEMMDMVGVLVCCVKDLNARLKAVEGV
jgi:hypothetical protein